jgi:hypothetical protein
MSSTTIVRDSRTFIQNKLLQSVPTKRWQRLAFGLEAFALRPFQSAGSNARTLIANANTAGSKVLRLLQNKKLADHPGVILDSLGLVRKSSYCNADHSGIPGPTILVGALQTRNGKAIPAVC